MLEQLKSWDTQLFLFLNGKHNALFDPVMYWASNKLFWIPFYCFLAFLIIRLFKKRSMIIFIAVGLLVTATDQLSSHLIKPWVKRLRPSHTPAIENLVHLSKAGAGGLYGFVSSHAANCFGLCVLLCLLLPRKLRWLKYILICWAVIVSYSRIYVGVHYPGDVLCGGLLGAGLGCIFYLLIEHFFPLGKMPEASKTRLNKTV